MLLVSWQLGQRPRLLNSHFIPIATNVPSSVARLRQRLKIFTSAVCIVAAGGCSNAATGRADATPDVTVDYLVSTASIANPERGFYHHIDCNTPIDRSALEVFRQREGNSLLLCAFYLTQFKAAPISQAALDFFQQQMSAIRAAGFKAVLRFAYTSSGVGDDAPPPLVLAHLSQLAPYLSHNKDVIAVVQAGLVGDWGEWSSSKHFGSYNSWTAKNWADRKALIDKLLQVVPAERMIQLRTPESKTRMYGSAVLTPREAFSGSTKARIGQHNDCFLAKNDDYGTYVNKRVEYPWLAGEAKYLPVGGETCNYISPRSDCPNALTEMAMFHWSYLNIDYNKSVLDAWKAQGCFGEVKKKLGYRFALQRGTYALEARAGGTFTVNLKMQNEGWAAPFNNRDVELVLRNNDSALAYRIKLDADPRRWLPGKKIILDQIVTLPTYIPTGRYTLLLGLPDPEPALRHRADYAIRLANEDMWEADSGLNRLQHILHVTGVAENIAQGLGEP